MAGRARTCTVTTLVLVSLLVALAGACSSTNASAGVGNAQPAPNVSTFGPGDFDTLPRVPGSDSVGNRSETNGVVTESFQVKNKTSQDVLDFYRSELAGAGWQMVQPAYRADTADRADWVRDGQRLEVSTTPLPGQDNPAGSDYVVQYSLELRPQ